MPDRKLLVVDDEENTRITLQAALDPLGYDVALAASGEEALEQLGDPALRVVLLDLKMPGVSGLEVLRRIQAERPDLRVVIITAHGTVDSGVESMKLGAVDFLQKPFSVDQIRSLVQQEMEPDERRTSQAEAYEREVVQARAQIGQGRLDVALAHLRRAEGLDPDRPEAFNLIGVVAELRHDRTEAQKQYRVALDMDPTYVPARDNLHGSTRGASRRGPPSLG